MRRPLSGALLLVVASACHCCQPARGVREYEEYIPNAESLYPVVLGHGGAGVVSARYGNVDNFGRALFNNPGSLRLAWAGICALDSDGDGRTNGEELGDPSCTWRPGQVSPPGPVSNPGVPDTAVVVSPPVTSTPSARPPTAVVVSPPVTSTPSARPPAAQPSAAVLTGAPAAPGSGSQVRAPDERSALSATELAIISAAGVLVVLSVAVRSSKAYNERKLVAMLAARGPTSAPTAEVSQVAPWKV
jgi:hypothetical protein